MVWGGRREEGKKEGRKEGKRKGWQSVRRLFEKSGTVELGKTSRDSTGFGEMEGGLISRGGRNLRVPLHF